MDIIKDITSYSQVNSYFPYRCSSASLILSIYFYIFLYLYITRITMNNDKSHLKSPKNQNRRAALGRPAIKLLGGRGEGGGFNCSAVEQLSPLVLPWFISKTVTTKTPHCKTRSNHSKLPNIYFIYFLIIYYKARQRAMWAALQAAHKQIDKKT